MWVRACAHARTCVRVPGWAGMGKAGPRWAVRVRACVRRVDLEIVGLRPLAVGVFVFVVLRRAAVQWAKLGTFPAAHDG